MPTGVYKRTKKNQAPHRRTCRTDAFREMRRRKATASWKKKKIREKFLRSKRTMAYKKKIGRSLRRSWRKKNARRAHYLGVLFVQRLWKILRPLGYRREHSVVTKTGRGNKYRLDFALIEKKIDIEADGPNHRRSRWYRKHDKKRDFILNKLGWRVIRIAHD